MEKIDVDAPVPERLHALDGLRGIALLLGVVLHATISFLPSPIQIWMVEDNDRSRVLAVLFFAIHLFRMTTFFLIAGFFAHMSFHRRGERGFICDRLKRIALPLLVGWPIVFAFILAVAAWIGRFPTSWPSLPLFPLGHFWFLYVLLQLYAAVLILRAGVVLIDPNSTIRNCVDRLFRAAVRSPFGAIVLALPVGVALALSQRWLEYAHLSPLYIGMPRADGSLVTNRQTLIGYGVAFSVGWLLHRQIELLKILAQRLVPNLCLTIVAAAASVALVKVGLTTGTPKTVALGAACYALAMWTSTFTMISLTLRFLSGFSPTQRYVADASYWIYLIHVPIVLALQAAVSRLDWPWPAKFTVILAVAFTLLFVSYQLLVRYSFIGVVLNGSRAPRSTAIRVRDQSPSPHSVAGQ